MLRGIVLSLLLLALFYRIQPETAPNQTNSVNFVYANSRRLLQHLLKTPDNSSSLTISLCLLLSGDIEQNPGPRTNSVYLCALCDKEVTWQCKAICCDECDIWIHIHCADVNSQEYSLIGKNNVQWLCPRCDNINCNSFTLNSFEISCYNSYSPLCETYHCDTIDSISSNEPFSPKQTSSPNPFQRKSPKSQTSLSKNSTLSRKSNNSRQNSTIHSTSVFELPRKTNLRVMNVNCQSVKQKRTELLTAINYVKPDLICGTESWLNGIKPGKTPKHSPDYIPSTEIFPKDYQVYRNDRNCNGGGVFILAHSSLTVEEQPQYVTNCEINWIKVKLKNTSDLLFGAFYMPHRNEKDVSELNDSLNLITRNGTKDAHIILAGDFNCPDINWDHHTVENGASDRAVQQSLADITSTASLTQIHLEPTRMSNLLDLVFTTNPSLLKKSTSIPGISDHDIVVSDFDTKLHVTNEKPRTSYKFHKANWDGIKSDLKDIYPEIKKSYDEDSSVEDLWTSFVSTLKNSMNKHIPSKCSKKTSRLPWINKTTLKLLKKKKKLYRKAKQTNNWSEYKKLQKHCASLCRAP